MKQLVELVTAGDGADGGNPQNIHSIPDGSWQ